MSILDRPRGNFNMEEYLKMAILDLGGTLAQVDHILILHDRVVDLLEKNLKTEVNEILRRYMTSTHENPEESLNRLLDALDNFGKFE